ncbi:MAG: sugar ABC transporter substrate-binding protein [Hyphomicrobiales bacterium]|nr:sugar ABC transporter substrate-binding protein [Hyphomicrobiales bacterium]
MQYWNTSRLIATAGAVAFSFTLGAGAAVAAEKPVFVFVTPLIAHPVWDDARYGFEEAAEQFGFEGQYVGPQTIDPVEMVNQIEIAIAQGVDGIISMPIAPEAMRPVWKTAAKANIPVVFVGSIDPESTSLASVGTDEINLGRIGAAAIIEHFEAQGSPPLRAVVMQSTMDASFAVKTRDSYLKHLEAYPDFEMVINESNNSDMLTAIQKYEAIFATYPEINLVIGINGEAGPAAAKVVKEQRLQDKITIVGIDDVAETLDGIEDGVIWGTVAQSFHQMGFLTAQILYDYVVNGKTPDTKNPDGYDFDSGAIFVTAENLESYKN